MKCAAAIALGLAVLCAACGGNAQQNLPSGQGSPQLIPRSAKERERTYQQNHRVKVYVDVQDGAGDPVKGLTAADFALLDAGVPQKIAAFTASDEVSAAVPAHVIVLVDGMNNSPEDLTGFRKDLNHMLRSGPLSTPISLLVLNHTGFTRMAPTADPDVLMSDYIREVKGLRGMACAHRPGEDDLSLSVDALAASPDPVGFGTTHNESIKECLVQRFRISIDSLSKIAAEQRKTPGRTILIWLGGGWPVPTEQGMRLFNANDTERFYEQVIDLTGTLRDAHITLDAIGRRVPGVGVDLRRAEWDRAFRGAASRDALSRQSVSLVAQAHQSGGQVFVNSQHVEDALRACMRDAGSFYQLSFDSEPSQAANEFRTIEVRVNRPGVTVRSATTYYAQP